MTITEHLHYYTVGNPISKAIISPLRNLFSKETKGHLPPLATTPEIIQLQKIDITMSPLWQAAGRNIFFIRLAGLSGASAVILGALGSHRLATVQDKGESKRIFDTANHFHFFHSLAFLGVPFARRPLVTGSLMAAGTLLFTGVLYYRAFTGDKQYSYYAPWGGTCLILAWLSFML